VRILAALLTILFTSACTAPSAEFPSADRLHGVLLAAVEAGPGTIVSLDSVIAGDWTALYVFSPYTSASRIGECVGARVSTHGIEARDDITLLVLRPAKGSARSIAIPRTADFAPEAANRAYPRGSASFVVREPHAPSWGHLLPASGTTRPC
jgi:hypothetical protein